MKFKLELTGSAPLIMQSDRLVDPFDPFTKEIKKITDKKTKKTEDDLHLLARLEWMGSLYHDKNVGVYIPGRNVVACIRDGAKRTRLGKDIQRAVIIEEEVIPLKYDGPRDIEQLYEDGRFKQRCSVVIKQARTIRTRPIFREWSLECNVYVDPEIMSPDKFVACAEAGGKLEGLGTWRPQHGRFSVKATRLDK